MGHSGHGRVLCSSILAVSRRCVKSLGRDGSLDVLCTWNIQLEPGMRPTHANLLLTRIELTVSESPVHPLAIVGITGLIVNALNLMPIGSLDGGRIAMSAFGRKFGGILGTVTLLLQASTWIKSKV